MTYSLVEERSVGEGVLGAIERIYRCESGYGLIVVTEPPGSEAAGRMTVTPVVFETEADDSYLVLSRGKLAQEGLGGALLEPRLLRQEEDLSALLEQLCGLPAPDLEALDL